MATDTNDGPSYHRPRFRFDVGLTPTARKGFFDARVERIVELIVELSDERRAALAQRLASLDGN